MDGEAKSGKALVRALLIDRLDEAGLGRPRKVTQAVLETTQDRLCERLSYMAAENLATLAEEMLIVGAREGGVWPAEIIVWQAAQALEPVPFREKRIITSWLASKEGPIAEAGGYLVELYRFLRASPRPVLAGDLRRIREQAEENNRRFQRVQERIKANMASAEDREWMTRYLSDQREARVIVAGARNEGTAA